MARVFFDVRSGNVHLFRDDVGREVNGETDLIAAAECYVARLLSTGGVSFLADRGCTVEIKERRRKVVTRVACPPCSPRPPSARLDEASLPEPQPKRASDGRA